MINSKTRIELTSTLDTTFPARKEPHRWRAMGSRHPLPYFKEGQLLRPGDPGFEHRGVKQETPPVSISDPKQLMDQTKSVKGHLSLASARSLPERPYLASPARKYYI